MMARHASESLRGVVVMVRESVITTAQHLAIADDDPQGQIITDKIEIA